MVPSFTALEKDFRLEYEGLHQICFACGRYGHKMDVCPKKMVEKAGSNTFVLPIDSNQEQNNGGAAVQDG
ncbi:hypothetical protein AHAS_Ahas15G0084100 [Arachis hypogaea]